MDFITQLFNPSQSNFDPLNFLGLVGTILASIYIFRKQTTDAFVKERHDKLIFPLFNALESVLYQQNFSKPLQKALQIIEENKNLADGKLLEIQYYCSLEPSNENFLELCSYVDKAYDKSCKKLGLKTRSISYRVNRGQYKNFCVFILFILVSTAVSLFIAMIVFGLFLFSLSLLSSIFKTADPTTKLGLLICLWIMALIVHKCVSKNL